MEGIINRGTMLDLGCGSGQDSLFASENGFEVTAVDKNPIEISDKVHFFEGKIEDFTIEDGKYDLIYSDNALPFLTKENAIKVLQDASEKIKKDGILYFSLFGEHDAWVKDENMNFWNREEVVRFVESLGLTLYRKVEEEGYAPKMNKEIKYWHIFRFILKK